MTISQRELGVYCILLTTGLFVIAFGAVANIDWLVTVGIGACAVVGGALIAYWQFGQKK